MKRRNGGWECLAMVKPSTYIQMYCDETIVRIDAIDGYDFKVLSIRLN